MTPAQLRTIEEIFYAALDQEPDDIARFLETACEGDELLRRKVEALLASRQRVGSFIETSAAGIATRIIENGQADLLVGQTFGHYKISKRIGSGGMGEVYLATDVTAGRKAALKLLPMRFTGDAERLKRFQQEAHAVVALNHPNILTVYEIGEDHSTHYIASELIEGETLRQRLARGRMELNEAVDIAIQVASALAAAHEAGIVHRDINPGNIMLRPDGYVKVLDFGIAKLAEQEVPVTIPKEEALLLVETNLGSILGTVRYMSPEQARGAQVDKRTDIWSLGVVLYEMVSGHASFIGDTQKEVMSSILEKEPPPLTSYIRHTPAELEQIINKTLRKDRKERYRNAHELLEALKGFRRKLEFESFFENGFFEEVKRRKVYRVAAAYIIAAAGIIQLASAAFPAWDLPNWALRLVIVLLLIGFPVALILGWVFDVTPQGIRATPRAAPGTHRRSNVIMLAATGVIISAVAGFFLLPRVSAHKVEKSIAVLPFLNMSADKGDEYLSDGVSEELIAALSKITGLQVKARTSSFAFKGKNGDIQQIGELLHVSYLLEGSVARAGNKLRITAQLIQASDGNHLWSDTYDREMQDIFAVRSEVAQQVAQTLKIRLLGEDKKRLDKKPTENIEAYNLYRQGRYYAEKFSQDGFKKALGFYQQAIEKDPHFALAYAGMADNYVLAADLYIPPREAFPKAKEAALKGIELDDNLAEAHASLGFVHFHYVWDWATAEKGFKRALALNPQSPQAHIHYTDYLVGMGRFNEAYDQGRHALEIDPVSPLSNLVLGWAFLSAGRIDDAIQQFSKAVELNPNDALARTWLGRAYLGKGMGQRAIEEMEVAHRLDPDDSIVLGFLGYGYAVTGRRADALKTLETLDEMEKKHYVSRIARAYVYAGLGDKDKAFEWLEKAYQERSDSLAWFRKAPESKSLQSDPRFAVLMRKMGFTEP
jgi:serine/threonine-protein kinase